MNDKLDRFVNLMRGIFELDKSDLDFGIYRIMNIRKAEIEKFLSEGLPAKITETLAPFAQTDTEDLKKQIEAIEKQAADFGIADISASPMAEKYNSLKAQLAGGTDLSALESDVYSALYKFFNRYYDEGDFISKRRYKEGVYAIPYEGEEVKLYWANQDQYYIKTSENFKDYTFKVDDYSVHFRIVDATTEQNNNKESDKNKRVFMLFTEDEENFPGIKTFEHNAETKEIIVRFIYEIQTKYTGKADVIVKKWTEDNFESIKEWLVNEQIPTWDILLKSIEHKKDKKYCLLKKHLNAYVAKNTFDYFIHKDLKGFLTRELDFYIKSEIMHLDDLDTSNEQRVETYLAKVKAVKRVGAIIIDFLAQIENFQKKLWLKKKFVIETNWCITLDRVDERFYPEIIENKAQIQEWIDMYAVDEIKEDLATVGFSNPPTVEFLRQNLNLVVDTKHFTNDFKERLIASIDNLDEQTGGLMINSDNYHALNLLEKKYHSKIKCTYIDPPYNSPASEVLYKNSFKHSAWLSLMNNRLQLSKDLLTSDGSTVIAIDKYEHNNLFQLCRDIFPENDLVSVAIEHNKKGTQGDHFSYSNEYAIFSVSSLLKKLNEIERPESEWEYSNFRNWGSESERSDAANCFYPIYIQNERIIGFGGVLDDELHPKAANEILLGQITVYTPDNYEGNIVISTEQNPIIAVWAIDDSGVERKWRYAFQTIGEIYPYLKIENSRKGNLQIKMPKYSDQYKTLWADSKYNAGDYGTKILSSMGFTKQDFEYPKSVFTVYDCIYAVSDKNTIILDYFAGSGTTAQSVIMLNKKDNGNRTYILVEMGSYFNRVTLPRVKKSIYGCELKDWKDGKPQNRNTGVSHIMKYMKLESYEDALSNISLDDEKHGLSSLFGDDYLINYMLDIEAEGSLLNLDAFKTPFEYKLKVTENNETKEKNVDVVETFNYLIGLTVKTASAITYFNAVKDENGEYEGAVRLVKDIGGTYGFKQIEGTTPDGKRVLVIWRTISDNLIESNAALDAYFSKHRINPQDREYNIIYVNGDNNLQNISTEEDSFKVQMTELEFKKRMFEEE